MELVFTLITNKTLHFTSATTCKLYLKQNGALVDGSLGEDRYTYDGMLFPDAPVTATGRKALHTYQPDLAAYHGIPGKPVTIPAPEGQSFGEIAKTLTLWLDSNAILSQGELQTYFSLLLDIDGKEHPASLLASKVHWEGHGLFSIRLEELA